LEIETLNKQEDSKSYQCGNSSKICIEYAELEHKKYTLILRKVHEPCGYTITFTGNI
jgi:hypothetical protein